MLFHYKKYFFTSYNNKFRFCVFRYTIRIKKHKFLNVNNYYSGKGLHSLLDNEEIIQKTEDDILHSKQSDGSYLIECKHGHKVQVKVSADHFYIFWTPRNGEPSGPGGCVIEKVDLYEVV